MIFTTISINTRLYIFLFYTIFQHHGVQWLLQLYDAFYFPGRNSWNKSQRKLSAPINAVIINNVSVCIALPPHSNRNIPATTTIIALHKRVTCQHNAGNTRHITPLDVPAHNAGYWRLPWYQGKESYTCWVHVRRQGYVPPAPSNVHDGGDHIPHHDNGQYRWDVRIRHPTVDHGYWSSNRDADCGASVHPDILPPAHGQLVPGKSVGGILEKYSM